MNKETEQETVDPLALCLGDVVEFNDISMVLRSVNWEAGTAIVEKEECLDWEYQGEHGTWKKPAYVECTLEEMCEIGLALDRIFARVVLAGQVDFARAHLTGKAKVSKRCLQRLERQLSSIGPQ